MKDLHEILCAIGRRRLEEVRLRLLEQGDASKRVRLLDLMLQSRAISDHEACLRLYDAIPNSAFSHLKARLRESILDILFPRLGGAISDPMEQVRQDCWRLFQIGRFLIGRGAINQGLDYLAQSSKIASKNELEMEMLLIEETVLQHFPVTLNGNYEDVSGVMTMDLPGGSGRLILKIRKAYFALLETHSRHNVHASTLIIQLQDLLAIVHGLSPDDLPLRLWFWRSMLLAACAAVRGDDRDALSICQGILQQIPKEQNSLSLAEFDAAYLLCARLAIKVDAIELAKASMESLMKNKPGNRWTELECFECFFLLSFQDGDYIGSVKWASLAQAHPHFAYSPFHTAKWYYYEAWAAFAKGSPELSQQLLLRCHELLKYKTKWLIGFKLLEIVNFIALKRYDLVEYKLNALKQLLKRQREHKIERAKRWCHILGRLIQKNYSFEDGTAYWTQNQQAWTKACPEEKWEPFDYDILPIARFLALGRAGFKALDGEQRHRVL